MGRIRTGAVVVGVVVGILGATALGTPTLVRRRAASWGAAHHAAIEIGSVRPSLRGIVCRDVQIALEDMPEVRVRLDQVGVGWGGKVEVYGGGVQVKGKRDAVVGHLRSWRASSKGGESSGGGTRRIVTVVGLSVDWTGIDDEAKALGIRGLSSSDMLSSSQVRFEQVQVELASGRVTAEGVDMGWGATGGFRVGPVSCERLSAVINLPDPAGGGQGSVVRDDAAKAETFWDRLQRERETVRGVASSLVAGMVPGTMMRIGALDAQIQRGPDKVTLGPGSLAVQEREGALNIELAPEAAKAGNGVSFRASIPTGPGTVVLDLQGGPVSLSVLGLRDGDLGLKGVDRAKFEAKAHIEFQSDPKVVSFEGTGKLIGLGIENSKLAPELVEGLSLGLRMKGAMGLDGGFFRLDDGEFDVGAVQLELRGNVERRPEGYDVDAKFGIPLVSCQAVLDAFPKNLIPTIYGTTAVGTLSLRGRTHWEAKRPDAFVLDYIAANDCRATHVPASIDVSRFRMPFRRMVYAPDGTRVEVESGPGTPGWVEAGGISQFMDAAVMTTEDGRFRLHQGFDHEAIRNSVRENLKAGKFLRGASTISMQLAKNLYLDRTKNLSRKLQELILTMYLEQALTKDQILALYLNVIEFGPMIYGIGPASEHYFKTAASELSVSQAMYLSSILPNPKRQYFGAGGKVTPSHTKYLHRLIRIAGKMHWLSQDEVERGVRETPVLGLPQPERSEPDFGDEDGQGEAADEGP